MSLTKLAFCFCYLCPATLKSVTSAELSSPTGIAAEADASVTPSARHDRVAHLPFSLLHKTFSQASHTSCHLQQWSNVQAWQE